MRIKIISILKRNKYTFLIGKSIMNVFRYLKMRKRNYIFRKNALNVLKKAIVALDEIGVNYWVEAGTLLGIIRDNRLLANDLDLDLGVYLKDYSEEIDKAMLKHGFKLIHQYEIDKKEYGLEQTYSQYGVTIDIFYFCVDSHKMWMHAFVPFPGMTFAESIKNKGGLLPLEQYYPLCKISKISFNSIYVNIPDNSHERLEYHYGKDYMVKRRWNYMDINKDNINAKYIYDKIGKYAEI